MFVLDWMLAMLCCQVFLFIFFFFIVFRCSLLCVIRRHHTINSPQPGTVWISLQPVLFLPFLLSSSCWISCQPHHTQYGVNSYQLPLLFSYKRLVFLLICTSHTSKKLGYFFKNSEVCSLS